MRLTVSIIPPLGTSSTKFIAENGISAENKMPGEQAIELQNRILSSGPVEIQGYLNRVRTYIFNRAVRGMFRTYGPRDPSNLSP
jgi:hypothetical protein